VKLIIDLHQCCGTIVVDDVKDYDAENGGVAWPAIEQKRRIGCKQRVIMSSSTQ